MIYYSPENVEYMVLHNPTILLLDIYICTFPGSKEPTCQCRRCKRCGFNSWVGKIPWRRAWQPTPVILPREFHGQRSLVDHSPWGCTELDMTEET